MTVEQLRIRLTHVIRMLEPADRQLINYAVLNDETHLPACNCEKCNAITMLRWCMAELKEISQQYPENANQADAAYLRLAFNEACETYGRVFEGQRGKLPKNYRMSKEEEAIANIWAKLYSRVIETGIGVELLKELSILQDQKLGLEIKIEKLRAELFQLSPTPTVKE